MCVLIFHTTKLAKIEFVVPRRPIGIALVFGQLIWLSDPTASQWDLTQFHTMVDFNLSVYLDVQGIEDTKKLQRT